VKTLRDYQRAAIDSLYAYWSDHAGNPLIVAPCGAGKSLIAAHFITEAVRTYPGTRIIVLTHRAELLEQDAAELAEEWPEAPYGFFSASIGRRDRGADILFAGIQTIYNKVHQIDPFDLCIIDEAHLYPRKAGTQYAQCLDTLRLMNPRMKVVGLTATPYRLDNGMLHEGDGALFDAVTYDIPVRTLLDRGELCEVVGKRGAEVADLSGVHKRGGEFVAKEMAERFDKTSLTEAACREIVSYGANRKAWLIFAAGVDHAQHIRDMLRDMGVDAEAITGGTNKTERAELIERFRAGRLRCLVNCDVLTIGFNAPICDMGVLLRATASTALYVQIVGRLMRTYPGKENALLLDYGGNVERHGPIDDVKPKRPGSGQGEGEMPAKACPKCHSIVHLSARECPDCGYLWPEPEPNHDATAYGGAVMSHQIKPEWLTVSGVTYSRHQKPGKPDSVRVTYRCGLRMISHWWCPEHEGYARRKTEQQWRAMGLELPETVEEVLSMDIPEPERILVKPEGKYERVIRWDFGDQSETEAA